MTSKKNSRLGHFVVAKLKQCIYYDRNSPYFGAEEFRTLWGSFKRFGEYQVKTYLWDSSSDPHTDARAMSLGSTDALNKIVPNDCTRIYGGVEYVRSDVARDDVHDGDFDFTCCGESAWSGVETPPRTTLCLSDDWVSRIGIDDVLDVMHQHFQLADRFCPRYGLIDFSVSADTIGGQVYDSVTLMKSSLHHWVEQSLWYQHRFEAGKLRGVYWGNYLCRSAIDQLNRNGAFLNRYRDAAIDGNGMPNALIWEFNNGAFLSLGLDPTIDCAPGKMLSFAAQANCNWLVRQFAQANLL